MISAEFLSGIPIFSSLSPSQLEEVSKSWILIEKNADEIIFNKGDLSDSIYLIMDGTVRIMLRASDGEELTLSVLKKVALFGELTLFDNKQRTATAIADEHTKLLKMSRTAFIHYLNQYPAIAINLLALLSKRLRDTNNLIEQQVTRNVNDEIAHELTFADKLADKFSEFIGSWTFILLFLGTLIGWISLNTYILFHPVDHYPFILLNLLLSCLAAFQAPIIMMSQGRQAKKDHIAAELDYKINLKAEWQIEEILKRLDKIDREEARKSRDFSQIKKGIEKLYQLNHPDQGS